MGARKIDAHQKCDITIVMTGPEITNGIHPLQADVSNLPSHLPITSSLALERITPPDAQHLFSIIEANPDIRKTVAWASRVFTPEDVMPRLQRTNADGRFGIISEGDLVGYIGIAHSRPRAEYGIGYFLDSAARGRGVAAMSVAGLMKQAQTALEARRFYLQIVPDNKASIALAKRLGFVAGESVMGKDFPVEQQRWRIAFN